MRKRTAVTPSIQTALKIDEDSIPIGVASYVQVAVDFLGTVEKITYIE